MANRCDHCLRSFAKLNIHLAKTASCQKYYNDRATENARTSHQGFTRLPPHAMDIDTIDTGTYTYDTFNPVVTAPPSPIQGVYMEEIRDEELLTQDNIEEFPEEVAEALGVRKTFFENLKAIHESQRVDPWYPFDSVEEWQLAKWLIENVRQGSMKEFLELPIVSINGF
jgi:hypothetical protein